MSVIQPFAPRYGSNQVLTANSSSQIATLKTGNKQLRVVNTGAAKGYFRVFKIADGAQSATVADCPVDTGKEKVVTIDQDYDGFSYISATGTTLEVMPGEGF